MKALIVVIAIFATSQAFAAKGKNCNPISVQTGGDGPTQWIYPCTGPVVVRGCVEGEVGYFSVTSPGGGVYPNREVRVCHNGAFFPPASEVAHRACNEGEVSYFTTYDGGGEINPNGEMRTCHNGTFYP